jgi:ubiquinone/menaquinone biosynthesis C-methylase UbiE
MEYLHGYSSKEQQRLVKQARFLAPWVYEGVNFAKAGHILEVGCGVGAQTEILLKKFPKLKITGIDISGDQLEAASRRLHRHIRQGRVDLIQADATRIPVSDRKFDGAFICWFLEHVPSPDLVLQEVRTKLKRGAQLYCTEVFNTMFFVDPYSPEIINYWMQFNDYQWTIKGHPFVGAQLGNFLKSSGYKSIETELRPSLFDSRHRRLRKAFIREWKNLLLSAAPALLEDRRVTPAQLKRLKAELAALERAKNSVFFYAWMRAKARA